jgi:hypothetical protein
MPRRKKTPAAGSMRRGAGEKPRPVQEKKTEKENKKTRKKPLSHTGEAVFFFVFVPVICRTFRQRGACSR